MAWNIYLQICGEHPESINASTFHNMSELEFDVGDRKLYGKRWSVPSGVPLRARILFNHGLNDHANRYNHFFQDFADKGYEVTAYDQRGQGRSVKNFWQTGATDLNRVMSDLDKIIEKVVKEDESGADLILAGHSNGGGLTLYYANVGKYRSKFVGFVCIHPWVGALHKKTQPVAILVWLVSLLVKIVPWLKIPLALNPEDMCNDQSFVDENKTDKHIMKWVSIGQLYGSFTRANSVVDKQFASQYDPAKPLLLLAGKNDQIVDYQSVQKAFDVCPAKDKVILINDGQHEVFRNIPEEREKFRDEILEWLDKHTVKATAAE